VHRIEVIADVPGVGHRADQGELVGVCREFGVQLADSHPWHPGRGRLIRPANFGGCVGLQIPGINVAGSAAKQDKDARFPARAGFTRAAEPCRHRSGQAHAKHTDPAQLQQTTARENRLGGERVDGILLAGTKVQSGGCCVGLRIPS
jgi:hypothetical protein